MGIFRANFVRNQLILCWFHKCVQFFLTEIIICYFNNKVLEKWANEKVLTSWLYQFSQHKNLCLIVLGCCLLIVVMKFEDNFASLRQLNSPNSREKFQICCIDVYWTRFLANLVGVCRFTRILQLHGRTKYQKPCNNNLTLIRWYSPASKIIVLPEGSSWGTLLTN